MGINIRSDVNRFQQILINLVSNAIKFTFKGHVEVKGSLTIEPGTRTAYLKIKVIDTGLGIKKDDIPKLFNIFGRLEAHTSANKTGAGLGLTISKALSK